MRISNLLRSFIYIIRIQIKENLSIGLILLFIFLGACSALMYSSVFGGIEANLWIMGAGGCFAALSLGLGESISGKSIIGSEWFASRPPGRIIKGLSFFVGNYLTIVILLLPSFLFSFPIWARTNKVYKKGIKFSLCSNEYKDFPFLLHGSDVIEITIGEDIEHADLRLSPLPVIVSKTKNVIVTQLEVSRDGKEWRKAGDIGIGKMVLSIPLKNLKKHKRIFIRKTKGCGLFFSKGSIKVLGAKLDPAFVLFMSWLAVVNFSLIFGTFLPWIATYFTRTISIILGVCLFLIVISITDILGFGFINNVVNGIAPDEIGFVYLFLGVLFSLAFYIKPGIKPVKEFSL